MKFEQPWSAKCLAGAALAAMGIANAEFTTEIDSQLREIGRGVCTFPQTAKIYRPLQPTQPYPGVSIARDQSFGPDPKNVLDVFSARRRAAGRGPC